MWWNLKVKCDDFQIYISASTSLEHQGHTCNWPLDMCFWLFHWLSRFWTQQFSFCIGDLKLARNRNQVIFNISVILQHCPQASTVKQSRFFWNCLLIMSQVSPFLLISTTTNLFNPVFYPLEVWVATKIS